MRWLAIVAAIGGCANERGLLVATGDDPIGAAVGEMLHGELAERPEGARRAACGETLDCLAQLRGGAIDVAVVERDELGWLTDGDDLVIAAELGLERRYVLVSMTGAPLEDGGAVATSSSFATRATDGLRGLIGNEARELAVRRIDDDGERTAALAGGAVDAAVFEAWRQPADTRILKSARGSAFVIVAREAVWSHARDRDAIGRAAGAVSTRIEKHGVRLLAAIAAGIDPATAVETLEKPPLTLSVSTEYRRWAAPLQRALATRSVELVRAAPTSTDLAITPPGKPPHPDAELVAVFGGLVSAQAEVWARAGVLGRAEAERVLASTASARLPAGGRPSIWRRFTAEKPAPRRGASRWLDTLLNLAVGAFLVWLLVLVIRRR